MRKYSTLLILFTIIALIMPGCAHNLSPEGPPMPPTTWDALKNRGMPAGFADDVDAGGGSAITFDIGDDGGDDSTDVNEIATNGDTNSVFTEPSADKLYIDLSQNWPTADAAVAAASQVITDNAILTIDQADAASGEYLRLTANGAESRSTSETLSDLGIASLKLDDFATPDDNTDLNATTTYHGLLPKLDNNAAHYLNGQGAWGTPAGGGTMTTVGEEGTPVGDADIVTLDFLGADFIVGESPDTEINVAIDYANGQKATNAQPGFATAAQITALEAIDTEAELEALLELQDLQGAVTDGQVPTTITLETISGTPVITNGARIGTDDTDHLIDEASNGAGSATLYIGNESILASGDIGVSVQGYDANTTVLGSTIGASEVDADIATQAELDAVAPTNITPVDTGDEDATFYIPLVDGATGSQATETDSGFSFNPQTNILSVSGGVSVPASATGPQLAYFFEDSDTGSNYVGFGSPSSNDNDLILLLPVADPAGEFLSCAAPSSVTFSDGVARDASVCSWASSGAETNTLETTITGIADTEIFVGDGADSGTFVVMSGDATLANTGALSLADDVVAAAEMADADHGDVSWSSGVATVDAVSGANSVDSDAYVDGSVDAVHISSIVDSVPWNAAGINADGTQCADPAAVQINSGPYQHTIICADNDASTMYGHVIMPDSWDGGTVTLELEYLQTAADTNAMNADVAMMCRGAGETVNNTWGSEIAIDDAAVTGSNGVDHTTSAAVTPNGTCAGGDTLYWRVQLDATGTTTAAATLHFLGAKIEYTSTVGD